MKTILCSLTLAAAGLAAFFASPASVQAQYPTMRPRYPAPMPSYPASMPSYRSGYGSPSYRVPTYFQPAVYPVYDHDYDVFVRSCAREPFVFVGRYETRSSAERAARNLEYRGYDVHIRTVHDHPPIYR